MAISSLAIRVKKPRKETAPGEGRDGAMERYFRNNPSSPIQMGVISRQATATVFEAHGDKAYIDGFLLDKTKGDANGQKLSIYYQQIINEHGQWRWFGSQK